MVKRTLVVLGILALTLAAATSHGFWTQWPGGGCGPTDCKPLYLPVDCPPVFEGKTIVKTWSFKSEGPCPAPGPACGPAACGKGGFGPGVLCSMAGALATPLDLLFGGLDGVYGCFPDWGGGMCGAAGPCGPCFGPVPAVTAAFGMALGAPTVMFGSMW